MSQIKLFEAGLNNNGNSKIGREYVEKTYGNKSYDFFWQKLIEAFPSVELLNNCTNGQGKAFFTLGVLRIAHDEIEKGNNYDGDLKFSLVDIINQLTVKPLPELNQNFNGMDLNNLFNLVIGRKMKSNDVLDKSLPSASIEDDGKVYDFGEYKVYVCFTYDSINKFKLPNQKDICYIGNIKSFLKDEGHHGIRAKYVCVRNDYAQVRKQPNVETYPYDDFGLSIIFISISPNGDAEICSRYNNGHRGAEFANKINNLGISTAKTFLTKEQIEQIVLKGQAKFQDIFKPFDEETYMFRRNSRNNLVRYAKHMEKIDKKERGNKEIEDEPFLTNWLRQNGKSPFPFKMAENLRLNLNDIQYILQETIKRINIIS